MSEQVINELCQKFHTTVDNLIPVYSKYAMSKDIVSGLISLLFMVICIGVLIYLRHKAKKNNYTDYWYDASGTELVLGVSAIVIAVFLFIAICVNIYDYVMWAYSPNMRFLDHVMNIGG